MAIEHATEMEDESPDTDQSSTAELPLSIVGGQAVKEGDVVRLKVISVGDGSITVQYAAPPKMGGSDGMAKEFDNKNYQEQT